MSINTHNSGSKRSVLAVQRTASKTVRNFTSYFRQDAIPQAISVSLDWYSCMVDCGLPEPTKDQGPVWLNDTTVLQYENRGTPLFAHSYTVFIHGEPVANVHTHGRNDKIIKPGTAKLELINHTLYSSEVTQLLADVMAACSMPKINNHSAIHLAIDGVGHIHKFLNAYVRQNPNKTSIPDVKTLGRWDKGNRVKMKGKARLDSKVFNRATGMFDNFKIGTARKNFVVYNKTSELKRSHKQYIRDMWDRNGIDQSNDVWRCELRLTSQSIKEIKNFDINRITDPNYLLQIFKTQCQNFFEFILVETDANVSRAKVIDLFQFEKLKVRLLEKIPRAIVRGAYKAMMSIHNAYMQIRLGKLPTRQSIDAALQHITDNCDIYHLGEWYQRHIETWEQQYLAPQYGLE